MKNAAMLVALTTVALALAACGGNDNSEACKSYVEHVTSCGGVYAQTYNESWCEAYDDVDCDVADYFTCLESALGECSGGDFPNADPTALSACASKATCD